MWLSRLKGRCLIDRQTVITGTGPFVCFMPAIQKPLRLFISRRTQLAHPGLLPTIQAAMGHNDDCKWKVARSMKDFMASKSSKCAICTRQEIAKSKKLRDQGHTCTKDMFLARVSMVGARRLGLAGMS